MKPLRPWRPRSTVDGRTREAHAMLRGLATSPNLREGGFAAFDQQARRLAGRSDIWIGVIDRSGQQRVNTRYPPGTPLHNVKGQRDFELAWVGSRVTACWRRGGRRPHQEEAVGGSFTGEEVLQELHPGGLLLGRYEKH